MSTKKNTDKEQGLIREHPTEYQAARRVSASEAARGFSELLNRILYRGEVFVVTRGGRPICELRPVASTLFTGADLVTLLRSLPEVDDEYLTAVEEAAREQPLLPESPWAR